MGLLSRLLLSFRPATLNDPEFGRLRYMRVGRDPDKSYWEAEWLFPPTGTRVSIGLPGTKEGPLLESRAFFLALIPEFERIMTRARPVLDQVFSEWLGRSLSVDLWSDVTLAGFGVEDPPDYTARVGCQLRDDWPQVAGNLHPIRWAAAAGGGG